MQFISAAFNYLLHFLKSCLRLGRTQYQPLSTTEANAANATPTVSSDVKRFLARFNAQYGTTHPVFFTGDDSATTTGASSSSSSSSSSRPVSLFEQVTKKAKQEFKLVLVYLHSEHHQSTSKFCRDVLCKESFKEYVDSNYIFFATDATSREGYLLTNSLQATTFPFLAVILCARGSPKAVCRIEGDIEVDALITKLIEVHENTTPILVVFQNEENERLQRIQQREEQDRAYQEAMERDRQAELERQRQEEEERLRIEAERQRELEKANRLERLKQERREIRSQIAEEPVSTPGGGDVCLIRFRLPDGSQIQRKFSKTDKVQKLYEFIHVLNHADGSEPVVAYPQTKWKSNETSSLSNYEIATSFPKTVLDKEKSLEEAKCFPTASVFVREEVSDE